jgi:hypothetical protein
MPSGSDIVVFGVASDGTVAQWDGHPPPVGILLRWFAKPEFGYPQLGFDLYRAQVTDAPPLPFNDLNVPFVEGKPGWFYANVIRLSCPDGLHFENSAQPGWWRLVIAPATPLSVRFTGSAWFVRVRADDGTTDLTVIGRAGGTEICRQVLTQPGETLTWRTRGLDELVLSGAGTVSHIGYHLLDQEASWKHLCHRCLPVIDPRYRCAPQPRASAADEARSRLPPRVAAQWAQRFASPFADLLPALARLATGAPSDQIPPDTTRADMRISGDERALIALSALDPHGARILGLAYDDLFGGGLDGREYTYKVIGRWLGPAATVDLTGGSKKRMELLRQHGVELEQTTTRNSSSVVFRFPQTAVDLDLELRESGSAEWFSDDGNGGTQSGLLSRGRARLSLTRLKELRLSWQRSGPALVLSRMRWTSVIERIGLLPGITAVEPGAPPGPASLVVSVAPAVSPSAIALARLDWPINLTAADSTPEGEPVSYQIGHRYLDANPAAPIPLPAAADQADLLYLGSPVFIQASVARLPRAGRVLHTDRNDGTGLAAGQWGWWVRGVDLFGRVSRPSPWAIASVVDSAPAPAPVLIQAEWVQRNLPAATVSVIGRSVEAQRWLRDSTGDEGLVVSWAYGPDQANLRPDVNGFQLLARKPVLPTNAAAGDPLAYSDTWAQPVASFGPMAIRSEGSVLALPTIDPVLTVTMSAVEQLAPAVGARSTDPVRSICRTNLELDGASSVFVGGMLAVGSVSYPIVANGDGRNLTVVVTHAAGGGPGVGIAQMRAPSGVLVEVTTNLPALNPAVPLRARSGVLLVSDGTAEQRLQALRNSDGVFLCRRGATAITAGNAATWFPVWSASLDNAGFGPAASETTPVAHAQVCVRAVRTIQSRPIVSAPSAPLTVTAVDLTVPGSPGFATIPFDPSAHCALVASRADWYGKSRFRMAWSAQSNRQFLVYRALGDEINRLDRAEHDRGAGRAHSFTDSSLWPAGVYADVSRRTRVLGELAALDVARAISDSAERTAAVETAYEAMTIDTQMLLARQVYAWPAYVALTNAPIEESALEDVLDGRSRGHWFYRVTSRTPAGAESVPSEPTPPICCPDVVPPSPPVAHMALADRLGNGVNLRWLASPDADTARYEIFAAKHPEAWAELADMAPVAVHSPSPNVGGAVVNFRVACAPADWFFWIVSIDTSGNRSAPSTMLRGKSLQPVPQPPVWISATRTLDATATHIALTWSHPGDQRLACMVERRPISGGYWTAVSAWLPRGVYNYDDRPGNPDGGWEYRLRVRDHLGQLSPTLPTTYLQAA